jgi:hypothetical protein
MFPEIVVRPSEKTRQEIEPGERAENQCGEKQHNQNGA